jgi:hypothetical protein
MVQRAASKLNGNIWEEPFALAVIVAVWFVMIDPTVAVKFPAVAPDATVTLAGTAAFAVLLDSATTSPALGAAPLKVTVQVDVPGAFTLDGLQVTPLGVTGVDWMTVMVPLVPDEGITFPSASDAATPLTATGTLVLTLPAEIVNVAVAAEPLGMALVVMSNMRQVVDQATLEHDTLFGPPTTATLVTSAG